MGDRQSEHMAETRRRRARYDAAAATIRQAGKSMRDVRLWAQGRGLPIADCGRIRPEIVEAYVRELLAGAE